MRACTGGLDFGTQKQPPAGHVENLGAPVSPPEHVSVRLSFAVLMPLRDADRENITARLSRIEGQVRGLKRMVDDDRYCGDILDQIHSVQKALKAVGRAITRNHLETCVTDAIRSGDESAAQESYDEIMGLLEKEL